MIVFESQFNFKNNSKINKAQVSLEEHFHSK